MTKRSPVRAFILLDIRDQVRDRSAMLGRLGPTLFVLMGLAFAIVTSAGDDESQEDRRLLAVAEDATLPDGLEAELSGVDLEIVRTQSVDDAVRNADVQAGLRLASGSIVVVDRADDGASALTARRVRSALAAWDRASNPTPTDIPFDAVEVEPTVTKVRRILSLLLPGALLTLMGSALGNSAMQWHESQRSGALVHQLTLPIPRPRLLVAKTAAEVVLTSVAMSPFIGLLSLGVFVIVRADVGNAAGLGSATLLVLVALFTVAAYAIVGLHFAVRHPERVTQGGWLTLAPVLLGSGMVMLYLLTDGELPRWLALVPVLGPAEVLRTLVAGELDPLVFAGSVATTVIAGRLVLRSALARSTDDLGMRLR